MDLYNQFSILVNQHEKDENTTVLADTEKTLAYLETLLPIEQLFRDCPDPDRIGELWKKYNRDHRLNTEQHRFRNDSANVNLKIARHFRYDYVDVHVHNYFQILYPVKGTVSVSLNQSRFSLAKGDILLISPGTEHSFYTTDAILIKMYLRVSTFEKTFFRWLEGSGILSEFFRRSVYGTGNKEETDRFLLFRTDGDTRICGLILEMYREYFNKKPYFEAVNESQLTELFCLLVRSYSQGLSANKTDIHPYGISYILHYISENQNGLTLTELADRVGYSKNYLCRLLKQETGCTFSELLNRSRIETASSLPKTTAMSISDIAVHAGFGSAMHFYREFRAIVGMTPLQYRKNEAERP